jgi:hypothetical protein
MSSRTAVVLTALAMIPHLASCGCTGINCASGASIWLGLSQPASTLPQSVVTLCRNGVCFSAPLPMPSTYIQTGTTIPFDLTSPARGSLWRLEGEVYELELHWYVHDNSILHDGDDYTVTVVDGDGQTTATLEQTVSYQKNEPNGTCGPTCLDATIDARGG